MPQAALTDKFCREVEHPESGQVLWFDLHKDAPAGFALRVTPGSKSWIVNYYVEGRQRRLTLPVGFGTAPLWGPARARKEASKIKVQVQAGADPIADREASREAREVAAANRKRKADGTLSNLMAAYVDHLQAAGKGHKAVSSAIERHVVEPFPRLAKMPASDLEPEAFMPVLSRLTEAGTYREAEKLKAYLSAGYTLARRSRVDAALSQRFGVFGVRENPLQDVTVTRPKLGPKAARAATQARKWALSEAELRAYWRRINAMDTPHGAMLRFHLLTGGQRAEMLTRLTLDDYDADAQVVTLWDYKGRRSEAREHQVPLLPEAVEAMDAMGSGPNLFTVSKGRSGAVYHTLREALQGVATAMVDAGEIERTFTPGIIRKTVETRLAADGVSKDVRAQLQSHGIGGVQDKHYDAHEYREEKLGALQTLRTLCEPKPDNVTPMRRRKAG